MENTKSNSPIEVAAAALRRIALATPEGHLLGAEDELLEKTSVARTTMRQAARLVEREGLVRVRRGPNGGYFSARPSVEMVEAVVCTYLNTLGLDTHHGGMVATALWVQVLREAAKANRAESITLVERLSAEIEAISPETSIEEIGKLERAIRTSIFKLIDGGYIEVLFRINAAFARQQISGDAHYANLVGHETFIRNWKKAKLRELEAIADGDEMLAMMAALHSRNLWMDRRANKQTKRTNQPR